MVSDLIVSYLDLLGVKFVFSVPGSPLGPLYDALVRSERTGGPRSILTRHEGGAAFMADGYARETGGIGVCCATTGPGATNLITGVAAAYADHIPLLVITAQTVLPRFGLGSFQESSSDGTDIVGMFKYFTCYNTLVSHPDQLETKLAAALTAALTTPKGPAHLSIPADILRLPAGSPIRFPNLGRLLSEPCARMDLAAVEKLCEELRRILKQGRRVALLIGHDCTGATQEITQFAERMDAPMATTQRGKSRINPYHRLACGVFGFSGHKSAYKALTDDSVGLILAVGASINEWSTNGWDKALLNDKLVHIHPITTAFARSPMARLHVEGDIRSIFRELLFRMETEGEGGASAALFKKETDSYVPPQIEVRAPESLGPVGPSSVLKPQRVLSEITQRFPSETRFFIDNSNSVPWSIHYFFHHCPERYHLSIGFASMGWAIGASVGAALGVPKTPVVCFTGDGCFLMSGQEITVAVAEKLPVIFVVLNDHAYGMIRHSHRVSGKEPVDFSIPPVDFCKMAHAVGADGYTIRTLEDLDVLDVGVLCRRNGPTVLDVYIDPEEVPPFGAN